MVDHIQAVNNGARWRVRMVVDVAREDNDLVIHFAKGPPARLSAAETDELGPLGWVMSSKRHGGPIALLLSEDNRVLAGGVFEETKVMEIEEGVRFPPLVSVWLGGRPAPRFLTIHDPRYERLRKRL